MLVPDSKPGSLIHIALNPLFLASEDGSRYKITGLPKSNLNWNYICFLAKLNIALHREEDLEQGGLVLEVT